MGIIKGNLLKKSKQEFQTEIFKGNSFRIILKTNSKWELFQRKSLEVFQLGILGGILQISKWEFILRIL